MTKIYDLQHVQPDARDLAPADSDRDAALHWAVRAAEARIRELEQQLGVSGS